MFEKYLKIFLSHPPLLVTSSNASRRTTSNKMHMIPDSRKDKHQRCSVAKCIYSTAYTDDQLSPLSTCHGTHLLSAPPLFSISKESSDSSLVDSTVLVSVGHARGIARTRHAREYVVNGVVHFCVARVLSSLNANAVLIDPFSTTM